MTSMKSTLKSDLSLQAPPAVVRQFWLARLGWVGIFVVLLFTYQGTEISPSGLLSGMGDSWKFIFGSQERPGSGFFPPDFSRYPVFLSQMYLTLKMAVWGTVLSLVLALPLAFAGAQNVSPMWLYQISRRVMDFLRGLNELVLALIFVAAVGLGPFPGILALALHTAGTLGKLLSESIEAVDMGQVEAVRSTGATPLMVVLYGFWPQVVPHFASYILYRFEVNVRAATVLGLVGAGGIGFYLQEAMRSFDFRSTSAILAVILLTVFLVDFTSARLRQKLI